MYLTFRDNVAHMRLRQFLNIGVLDQLHGTDHGAQTALVTLGVVDSGQALFHGDGIIGADLLALTAADTADGTGTGSNGALCHGVAGNDHIACRLNSSDQASGAGIGTSHTADTQFLIHHSNTVHHGDGAVLTGFGTGTVAQAAVLAGQRTGAANLSGCQTVGEAFVLCLGLNTLHQQTVGIILAVTGP